MDFGIKEIFDLLIGPTGGMIAIGFGVGVKVTWKWFDTRSSERYEENIRVIKKSAEEIRSFLMSELREMRIEMKSQDDTCKQQLKELNDKIYELMK